MPGADAQVAIVASAVLLSACEVGPPGGLDADGWLAARCEASAALPIRSGDSSQALALRRAAWEQTADPFRSSTDDGVEMRSSASRWANGRLDREAHARRFVDTECDDAALARVRARL